MPIYEYKCEGCGEVFEIRQKFADEPLKVHEKCGGAVHRLLSAPALQFKGSGWYITDYGRGSGGSKSSSESKSNGSSSSSETKSSETKSSETKSSETKSTSSESSSSKT